MILQVALDFVDLKRAMRVAREVAASADWLEAGTPLIKSEGMHALRSLKRAFPGKTIVADLKTTDTGALEAEMAAKSGADIVTVLGIADDSTIREAAKAAHRYGAKLMVDLFREANPERRAAQLAGIADYIAVHSGIDEQMEKRHVSIALLRRIVQSAAVPIAVGGGLNSENAAEVAKAGASIAVVGGAITKADDAGKAAREIKKALSSGVPVKSGIKKYGMEQIAAALAKVSVPNISDAMHHAKTMRGIVRVTGAVGIVGRAVTVRTAPGDWAKPVEAIDVAKRGDVIVIDAGGCSAAVWGGLASESATRKGIAGVVVDGAVRDVEEMRKTGFTVFARCVAAHAGEPRGWGEIGGSITCGGIAVENGDYVVADEDGVVVVPAREALQVANRAVDVAERENRIRSEIKRGETLAKVLSLRKWESI